MNSQRYAWLVLALFCSSSVMAQSSMRRPSRQPVSSASGVARLPDEPLLETPLSVVPPSSSENTASGLNPSGVTPTAMMQYEPQNVVLPPQLTEPNQVFSEQAASSSFQNDASSAPWILPYSSQFNASFTSGGNKNFGMQEFDARVMFGSPQIPQWFVTAGYGAHLWEGTTGINVPPPLWYHFADPWNTYTYPRKGLGLPDAVHDVYVELMTIQKLSDQLTLQLAASPGLYTDFENTSSDALRITGRALLTYQASDTLQLSVGAVYLDREDIKAVAAAGLVWTPNEDVKLELMFPRPRLALRLLANDSGDHWVYVGGEFGGGSWAVRRARSEVDFNWGILALPHITADMMALPYYFNRPIDDVVTYNALRFMVGYEKKAIRGWAPRAEVGLVFNRSIELKSTRQQYDLDNAFFARVGVSF